MARLPGKFREKRTKSRDTPAAGAEEDAEELAAQAEMGVSSKSDLERRRRDAKKAKSGGFESLGLCSEVFRGVKRKGYRVPTPIQRKTMPLILAGADVVAMARTGSGKTAAFLIPMLQRLRQHVPQAGVRALILSPTRELAMQTLKFAKELGRYTDLRICLLVGGDSMENQFEELTRSPDVIIATPGRLMHHLSEVEDMSLRTVEYVVFDEADCLFSMGFSEQLQRILHKLSDTRQTLLFSATMPSALAEFAKAGLRDPQLVRLDLETRISPDLELIFFTLRLEEKAAAVLYLVREHISSDQQTIIFVCTKHHVEFLNILFKEEGIEPSVSYGDMDQDARMIHLSRFRSRKTMVLIVTDIASRGLDIPLLDNVVNWDFPPKPKIFVHRVGRAGRQGRKGTAYSFVTSEDLPYLLDLHLYLSKPLRPAPTGEEALKDFESANLKIVNAISNGETVYGRFPQQTLDLLADRVREIISGCADLDALQKTCANGFRLYSKTKPLPSSESIRRAKELPCEGIHPIFRDLLRTNELPAIAFTELIKSFRPKQTILEAEAEAAKSRNAQGANISLEVMRKKKAVHDEVIKLVHQKRLTDLASQEEEPVDTNFSKRKEGGAVKRKANSFKDDDYYISSVPQNQHMEAGLSVKGNEGFVSNRLDAAVFDLVADDSSGLQMQKSQFHWDKKSKKYIKLNNGERVTATGKIKTESGAKVKDVKTGIYKKWKEKTHTSISLGARSDTAEEGTAPSGLPQGKHNRHYHDSRKGRWSVPNADIPSEIKDVEQVRKSRQQKATKVSFMKNKLAKNKFDGGKGKFQGRGRNDGSGRESGRQTSKFQGKGRNTGGRRELAKPKGKFEGSGRSKFQWGKKGKQGPVVGSRRRNR